MLNPLSEGSRGNLRYLNRNAQPERALTILAYETQRLDDAQRHLESGGGNDKFHYGVAPELRLEVTAKQHPSIHFEKVGEGDPFVGFSGKWEAIHKWLDASGLPDDAAVAICDNRDVMHNVKDEAQLQAALDEFVAEVRQQHRMKLSGESGCCVGALSKVNVGDFFEIDGSRAKDITGKTMRACNSGQGDCQWRYNEEFWTSVKTEDGEYIPRHERNLNPRTGQFDSNTYVHAWEASQKSKAIDRLASAGESKELISQVKKFYLNMGLLAGTKQVLMEFITALQLEGKEDDQAVATDLFLSTTFPMGIDYKNELFGNSHWQSWEHCNFEIDEASGRLKDPDTGAIPLFRHFPGMSKDGTSQVACMYRDAIRLGLLDPEKIDFRSVDFLAKFADRIKGVQGADSAPSAPLTKAALFENLDIEKATGHCGSYKCYFPNKDGETGQLVTTNREFHDRHLRFNLSPPTLATTWEEGHKLAEEIKKDFGIDHLMAGPPEVLKEGLSQEDKAILREKVLSDPKVTKHTLNDNVIGPILTQKVIKVPHGAIELKTENEKFETEQKNFAPSIGHLENLINPLSPGERESFAQTFSKEIEKMIAVLERKPFFAEDFHMMVDKTGKIYNTDLDGRFVFYDWAPKNDPNSEKIAKHVKAHLVKWDQVAQESIKNTS